MSWVIPFLRGLWRRAFGTNVPAPPAGIGHNSPPPDPVPEPTLTAEDQGQWYFKRDILDQLNRYFDCAARLKAADPEGYQFVARVGAMIVNSNYSVLAGGLDRTPPSMGAVAFTHRDTEPDDDTIYPVFMYFRRYDTPSAHVERTNGTIYEVTLFYADRKDRALTLTVQYHVGLQGEVASLLKERRVNYQHIPAKTPAAKRRGDSHVPRVGWGYPKWLHDFAGNGMTGAQRAKGCFEIAANLYAQASAGARVRVAKGSLIAAFTVDLLRMPYFFKDRDVTLTEGGKRRKIFHIVRTHARRIGSGVRYVKSHFRGERKFTWNGYHVTVSMPGKHHADLLAMNFGAHDLPEEPAEHTMISTEQMAKELNKHLAA